MENRVLIFSPHPDDAELGMGGAIAKFLDEGWEVILADLTDGEPTPAGSVEIREKETQQATESLGLRHRLCLGLPNRYLQNNLENRRVLAETIREYKPRWVFTVMLPDSHPDHFHTHHLVVVGRFAAKLTKTDMAFKPHYPERVFYFYASHLRIHPDPRFIVDVSAQWDRKIASIKAYQSQFWHNHTEPEKKGWVLEYVTTLCKYFGDRIGVEYAEPFFCHELVGLSKLDSLL